MSTEADATGALVTREQTAGAPAPPSRQMLLSDNPFDVLSNKVHVECAVEQVAKSAAPAEQDDNAFLEFLSRGNSEASFLQQQRKIGIYRRLQFFSKSLISIVPKRYYRYPFDWMIKNDGSDVYKQFYAASITATSSVYSNYRRFKEEFRMIYNGELIHFGKTIRTTPGLERVLRQNDIHYEEKDGFLVVGNDIALVYDMIVNEGVPHGNCLPFILAEYEFENAIVYHTRVERGPVVNTQSGIEYVYYVHGPLFSGDFDMDGSAEVVYIE